MNALVPPDRGVTFSAILALALVQALGPTGISAQNLETADGLQSAYGRLYSNEPDTTVASSTTGASTPDTESGYESITVIGLSFESEDDATAFLGELRSNLENQAEQSGEEADAEFQEIDFDKEGFLAVMNVPNTGVNTVVLFVDGNTLFLVDVSHPDRETANTMATDVATFVAHAETENEAVSFNEDGTSTGGVFDRMPTTEDEVVGDLNSMSDSEIFLAPAT